MAKITIVLADELEKKFREKATEQFGDKKGKLQKGYVRAIEEWIKDSNFEGR